ncbi:MAG TPA: hypothetical protein VF640_08965 [Acidimicrobiales bacterium]
MRGAVAVVLMAVGVVLAALAGPAAAADGPAGAAPAPPPTEAPGDEPLAVSGGDVVGLVVIGAVAVAVGTVLVVARRRAVP